MKKVILIATVAVLICSGFAFAVKYQPAGDEWLTKWFGMDLVTQNGGFQQSAQRDWLDEGTNGKLTDESVTTQKGLLALSKIKEVKLPKNGGNLKWEVVTIVPTDGNNMSTSHGLGPQDNIEWYGIIVIDAPKARTTTMHPAHDDHAHIWLNGEKVYDNPQWTGGATTVTTPTDVKLIKGENILLFRCGESGGSDYINLHFEAADKDLKIVPSMNDEFWKHVRAMDVEPQEKFTTTWAEIKE